MKDINIPLPDFLDKQIAEIEVKINGKKRQYNFRLESFRWEPDDEILPVEERLNKLRDGLNNYDKSWQLIQIFKPGEDSKFVQVLFRQKGIS
jgi:hypothetical protein